MTLFSVTCSVRDDEGGGETGDGVSVEFSFSFREMNPLTTKADYSQITELDPISGVATFRGLEGIKVIPFSTGSKNLVVADSRAIGVPRGLPSISGSQDTEAYTDGAFHEGIISSNHSHFYPRGTISFPANTSSVLVYGRAPRLAASTPVKEKMLNGSLLEEGLDGLDYRRARAIFFTPDPIFTVETASDAQDVADLLNSVAKGAVYEMDDYYWITDRWESSKASVSWDASVGDDDLEAWFREFTGNGDAVPGNGRHLKARLTTLKQHLDGYNSTEATVYTHEDNGPRDAKFSNDNGSASITYGYLYNQLREMLLTRVNAALAQDILTDDVNDEDFPVKTGLPSGSVVFLWNDATGFSLKTEGLDGWIPTTHYCYMPSLYYYVNTNLSVSYDRYIYEKYNLDTWEEVLAQYSDGKVVTGKINAVALDRPLQYACAMLLATVKAEATTLPDNDGNAGTNCNATGTNFPVTGIVLGSQFKQNFDFTPLVDDDTQDALEYYMYDGEVKGLYLTTTKSAQLRTLVLPTPVARDVFFYLELRNDSGAAFTGKDGVILPGCRFYLAGKLAGPSQNAAKNRVFMPDYYTQVDCTVETLANAYLSIPQGGDPQLALGVQCVTNWYYSHGSYVVFD